MSDKIYKKIMEYIDKSNSPNFAGIKKLMGWSVKDLEDYKKVYPMQWEQIISAIEDKWIDLGSSNKINVTFAIFFLKNHFGWTDKIENNGNQTNTVVIVNDLPKK